MQGHLARPSVGGGKYGTSDMVDYLQRMGKQLEALEAQHQQVCVGLSFNLSEQAHASRSRPGKVGLAGHHGPCWAF